MAIAVWKNKKTCHAELVSASYKSSEQTLKLVRSRITTTYPFSNNFKFRDDIFLCRTTHSKLR